MATNPWIIADGVTLDQFQHPADADRLSDFLQEHRHRDGLRGRDHDGGERARRVLARPDEILGLGHPGDRNFPDLSRARHAAVHPAVPDRQGARAAQLLLGHGAGLSDAHGAVLHLDHDRLLPVDPEGARRSGPDRRRRPPADAHQDLHPGGAARHHRRDDLRLHRLLGGVRLSDGVPLLVGPAGAHRRHGDEPDPRRRLQVGHADGRRADGRGAAARDLRLPDGLLHRRV